MKSLFLASTVAVALTATSLFTASPAQAGAVCPTTITGVTNCNLIVTFGPNGAITTSGPGGNYDGSEDALIGVVNNSGHSINSFNISGNFIFGFDGDGIDTGYITGFVKNPSNPDTTGYGGPDGYFTNISGFNSGTVNFVGGIANGGTDYFSLEEPINLNAPPIFTAAPEPASLALIGAGLLGVGAVRRRRS